MLTALIVAVVAAVLVTRLGSPGSRSAAGTGIAPVPGDPRGPVTPTSAQFSYGFDLAEPGPYFTQASTPQAVSSARRVMSAIPGLLEDTPIMDWGLPDPEPSPGVFNLSALAARIALIRSTGGTPVITLCAAPDWMTGASSPNVSPTPAHFHAFAVLAAHIARSFPQVKYFVVWNELKGFWNPVTHRWAGSLYTTMYNEVYTAIKSVRPDALVGGPYAPITPYAQPQPGNLPSTPHGAWGYLDQRVLDAISYWLANRAGADFIAVDGSDYPPTGQITNPLTATNKYAVVDHWLRERTALPIWWMESPVQPSGSGWSENQAAAIRIAALLRLAGSGARAALEWQPQQAQGSPDEGLWSATSSTGGGQPTMLAHLLPRVLAVLRYPTSIVSGQYPGILAARSLGGTILINTTTASARVAALGMVTTLRPAQVSVRLAEPPQGAG